MTSLAFSNEFIIQPLVYAIQKNLIKHPFEIKILPDKEIVENLLNGSVHMGLISPLHFAMNKGELSIIKEFVISSRNFGRNALLFFKISLDRIETITFHNDLNETFDLFIGELVINEIFDIQANWKGLSEIPEIRCALKTYPVIFCGGQKAFDTYDIVDQFIDLSEEWIIKNGLPLIHKIMVVRDDFKDNGEINALKLSRELGIKNLMKI